MIYTQGKKQSIEIVPEEPQTGLLDKHFRSGIINMFKELKDIMSRELKEDMRTVPHQTENTSQEKEILKHTHTHTHTPLNKDSGVEKYTN